MNLLTPSLFLAGSLLVAGPIVIHLLNRRRFKRLNWAAMDFLMEANRRSRRRIRLEDLLLLLLRCAAVVLLALLVARPFRTQIAGGQWLDTNQYQRIVVLDDSLSMQAREGDRTLFDEAKDAMRELAEKLAAHRSADALRLVVTSRPQAPVVAVDALSDDNLGSVLSQIEQLQPSSRPAHYAAALAAVRQTLDDRTARPNRIVYIITDLRQRDFAGQPLPGDADRPGTSETQQPGTPGDQEDSISVLRALADDVAGCFLVDFGNPQTANLVLARIVPKDRVLAAGVTSEFDIEVRNFSDQAARDVDVRFTAEGSLPIDERIATVPAGGSAAVQVRYAFPRVEDDNTSPPPVAVRVELTAAGGESEDRVAADNVRHFAARVQRGIRTLIVDGDPTPTLRRSESYYLRKALSPPGEAVAGTVLDVVGPSEFETVTLDDYEVVFLCNLEDISTPRRTSLEAWVRQGGGLVIAPGDQLYDPTNFNSQLYRDGEGLAPVRLDRLAGSETQEKWVHLLLTAPNHDVLRLYEGQNNPLLQLVKVFRWWATSLPADAAARDRISVLARYTDPDRAPAMVEHRFGDGRVVMITTPLDKDWSNWPEEPAGSVFVATMQDLTRYVARATSEKGAVDVGQPIVHRLDLTRYQRAVTLRAPDGQSQSLQPVPAGATVGDSAATESAATAASAADSLAASSPAADLSAADSSATEETLWQVRYDDTNDPGCYRLGLTRIDERPQEVMYAANVETSEGDLTRADRTALAAALEGSKVQIADRDDLMALTASDVRSELWKYVVGIIAAVLSAELLLGWTLGRRRN